MEDLFVKTKGKVRQGKGVYYREDVEKPSFTSDYGRLVQQGYVFFDFDDQPYVDKITKIIDESGLRCKKLETTRGVHFLFKTNKQQITNNSKNFNWLGLKCDVKGVGLKEPTKQCYQAIKVDGILRKETCLNHSIDEGIEVLDIAPNWLYQASKKRQVDLTEDQEGGRNDMFHGEMMIECKKNGFTYEEYCYIAKLINNYVLPSGLPEEELETAIRQEEWDKLNLGDDKMQLLDMAQDVIDHWDCKICGGKLMFYDPDVSHYVSSDIIIDTYLQEKYAYENITTSKIKEVRDQMNLQLGRYSKYQCERNSEYIVCKDKLVSTWKNEEKPISRTIVTDVIYPYTMMSDEEFEAYRGPGWKFIDDVSCHHEDVKTVILECLGCMMAPVSMFGKIFIWFGGGANGKSLLLKLMDKIMGDLMTHSNVLNINDKFALENVVNGICNVTDDVGITTIKETGLLKSVIDGSEIEVHRKYKSSIKWKPNSQFVMCCNELPRIDDTTNGMIRRLVFVPFEMQLKKDEMDIFLFQKLSNDVDAMRYIMTAGIKAYRKAVKAGQLTTLDKQTDLQQDFIEENKDQMTEFYEYLVDEQGGQHDFLNWLDGKLTEDVYDEYKKWCNQFSGKVESQLTFTRRFKKKLPTNMTTKVRRVSGVVYNVYEKRSL